MTYVSGQKWVSLGDSFDVSSTPSTTTNSSFNPLCVGSLEFMGFTIEEPMLVPSCILAAMIGLIGGTQLMRLGPGVRGHFSYGMSFLMFACMMSDAMLSHCFLYALEGDSDSTVGFVIGLIDLGLTSSIGFSFFWNGLVDVGLLDDSKLAVRLSMVVSYVLIFAAWAYSLVNGASLAFFVLYLGIIVLSGGVYGLCQLYVMLRRRNTNGWQWFVGAMVSGFVGVSAIFVPQFAMYLCNLYGSILVTGDVVWFFLSDAAMYCLYQFFVYNKVIIQKLNPPQQQQVETKLSKVTTTYYTGGAVRHAV